MAVNVARIYEQTIRPGRNYCRICLRNATETILVTPKNLIQFTEILKLNIFDGKKKDSVCYMCEAAAKSALRLYHACVNAVTVKTICQPLKNMKADDQVPEWLRKSIVGCNAQLREYRQRTILSQTEILVVDSIGMKWQPDKNLPATTRVVAPIVPIDLPSQPPIETVVLDDDEEETPTNKLTAPSAGSLPKLVPIQELLDHKSIGNTNLASFLPDQMQIITRHATEMNNFVLHPVVKGNNGSLIAPSLGCEIKNGQLVYDPLLFRKLPMVDCTGVTYVIQNAGTVGAGTAETNNLGKVIPVPSSILINQLSTDDAEEILPDSGPTKIKRQCVDNNIKKKKLTINFPRQRYYGTDEKYKVLPKSDHAEITKLLDQKAKPDNADSVTIAHNKKYVVDLDLVNSMLANNDKVVPVISNVTSVSDKEPIAVISNVTSDSDNVGSDGFGVVEEVVSRAPKPVENNVKIDWEDKIPMDVISFVDSTDPCTQDIFIAQPNQAETGVIDLC